MYRLPHWRRAGFLTAAFFLASAAISAVPAHAQLEITPHVGMYVPLGILLSERSHPESVVEYRRHQVSAGAFGARAAYWLDEDLALEGTVTYSPSMVAVRTSTPTVSSVVDVGAAAVMASGRALLRIGHGGDELDWGIVVGAGVAAIDRFGDAWAGHGGTTDLAAMFGVIFRTDPLGLPGFRIEVEDYVSWAQFTHDRLYEPQGTRARLRHDLVWSIGFGIPF